MKGISKLFLIALLLIITVGCGKADTLTCEDGNTKLVLTFDGDKVSKVKNTVTYDTELEAKTYEALFSSYQDGSTSAKRDGKKLSITTTYKDEDRPTDYNNSKAKVKELMELDGWKCN